MAKIKIKQIGSPIRRPEAQKKILIGLGLGTALSGNVTGFVRYDGDLGRKDQINTISAGLRFGW